MESQTSNDGTRTAQRYVTATLGSRSERGGMVVAARETPEGVYIGEHKVACVGDLVRYPDGSESTIVSGAGEAHVINGKPVALVGSHVANGDRIASSLQSVDEILIKPTDAVPRGLLVVCYNRVTSLPTLVATHEDPGLDTYRRQSRMWRHCRRGL